MGQLTTNVVTSDDTRSKGAGSIEKCFYCKGLLGKEHDSDCVCLKKAVKLKVSIEIVVEVPRSWDQEMIEFHRNDSSWCANNFIDEMQRQAEAGCACSFTSFELIGEASRDEWMAAGISDSILEEGK